MEWLSFSYSDHDIAIVTARRCPAGNNPIKTSAWWYAEHVCCECAGGPPLQAYAFWSTASPVMYRMCFIFGTRPAVATIWVHMYPK